MSVPVVDRNGYPAEAFHPQVALIGNGPHEKVTKLTTSQTGDIILCPLDRLEAFSWTPILFPFENINNEDNFMSDDQMIAALQKLIERVPVVTGHLERIDKTPVIFEGPNSPLKVCVGTRSVWYTSAKLKGSFQSFKDSSFSYEHLDPNYVFRAANDAIIEGKDYPLLTAKVNRFECGSVLLLVTACHLIVDARSMYEFVKSWGLIYRGIDNEPLVTESRHLFSYDDELNERTRPIHAMFDGIAKQTPAPFKTTKLVHVSIDDQKMKAIKEKINSELTPDWVSSDDVMVALGWRIFTRAKELKPTDSNLLVRIYDIRKLNQPPLPMTSFSNGVSAAITGMIPVCTILDSPLSELCKLVRTATTRKTPQDIRDELSALAKVQFLDHPPGGNCIPYSNNVFSSSYAGFHPSKLNFHNSPALTVTRACLTEGIVAPQPIINGKYSCKLSIDSTLSEKFINDPELVSLGFTLEL
ncbi:hypothetical protein DSO57_1021411 [Entomophthora muscae]|uniref:Uncharacterized protein n=1 Tax=Entomophthora muscae TaxID=34485 RepID=A0ACC2SG78_9FUNG|nr:hypothetical protein DSO57_1021411 [Entomophthora muscae]